MKNLWLILLVFIYSGSYAQYEISLNEDNEVYFVQIIEKDGSASELYELSNKWVAYTYTNPDYVKLAIIHDEFIRGNGMVKSAVLLDAVNKTYHNLYYMFEMRFQDNRIRFKIYNIRQGDIETDAVNIRQICFKNGKFRSNRKSAIRTKEGTEAMVTEIIEDYKAYLQNPEAENDW